MSKGFPFIKRLSEFYYFFPVLLTLIYAVMLVIVNPIGDFPLNDDWIYAHPVLSLISNGTYGSMGWSVSTIVTQVLWGFLFCKLSGGFSFTALRFSTLTLGLAGIIVFYFLVNDVSKNRKLSFLTALLLMANPIYFCCSNTFMTDVPFMSFALFAMYFFFKALDNFKLKFLIIATLFTVAAVLVRQLGLIIPFAYAITAFIKLKQPLLKRAIHFIPLLISFIAYELYLLWLKHIGTGLFWIPSSNYTNLSSFFDAPGFWLSEIARRLGGILFYFGLLFLPLLLIIKTDYSVLLKSGKLKFFTIVILAGIAVAYILFYRLNVDGNFLHKGHVGPRTLFEYEANQRDETVPVFWYVPGILGAILLTVNLICTLTKISGDIKSHSGFLTTVANKYFFVALCILGYTLLLLYPTTYFDRYLIPLFAWVCILITSKPQINRLFRAPLFVFTTIYISVLILFSAFTTHDYLAWNRVRWQAIDYLTKDLHISMRNIVAGYEANGWLTGYDRKWDPNRPFNVLDANEYLVSFKEKDGYQIIYKFPYEIYMPPFNGYIFVSHNQLDEAAQEIKKQISLNPQNAKAYDQLGLIYFKMDDFDNAIQAWDNFAALSPPNAYCYNNLGLCYLSKLNNDEAEKYFQKSINIDPDFIPAYIDMMRCYQINNDEQSLIKYIQIALKKGVSISYIEAHHIKIPENLLK